jgi:hypothetical protein
VYVHGVVVQSSVFAVTQILGQVNVETHFTKCLVICGLGKGGGTS